MALNNLTVPTDDADEFQRILDAAYKKYQDSIENLTDAATDDIETAINRHDMALKEIVREYVADASQLAKDYHHLLRQAWGEYSDTEFPSFSDDGLVDFDRVLWQTVHGVANTDYPGLKFRDVQSGSNKFGVTMDDLWPSMDNVDDAQQFIGDMISAALRSQTQRSIRRDPTKPHWARVPQGKACVFCSMLASRGFAYTSEEAAGGEGNKYHDDCHCRVIPSWGKQTLAGYDPDKYKDLYESAKRMAADAGESTSSRNVFSWLREQFPHAFTDGSALDPELRIPRGCELYKALGKKHALRVDMMLNASKHPDTARLWAKYAKDYLILDKGFGGTPYFSPVRGGIFLDLEKIFTGDKAHRPYQNLIHETAHMLDQLLGGNVPYSYQQMFGTSIRNEGRRLLEREKASIRNQRVSRLDEIQSYFNKHGRWKKADLAWMKDNGLLKDLYANSVEGYGPDANMRRHIEQLKNSIEISDDEAMRSIAKHIRAESRPTDRDVDDILQAALGDDYPRSVGHDDGYFSSFQHVCGEPWAEIMDAQLANPAAYKLIEQYFPKSVTIFNTMVKEALA
ncbi:hypothetical protein PG2001B_1118 [Bifidobacterium pseudolongum subsp. globosum]|uniref:Uncharacterized protein n=1 Tax=Bifidobacterium pseudolongum subsp. globosum TaxID=1690 RepID=A0A4V1Y565_9BIFI|nr:hypothetical protein [Bifidobacterium pseudolongum]RYQ39377.1 hypothetical protein PG2001B_1118 [Bifidobacterium pseudolongum subsp. globosum]